MFIARRKIQQEDMTSKNFHAPDEKEVLNPTFKKSSAFCGKLSLKSRYGKKEVDLTLGNKVFQCRKGGTLPV